MRKRNLFSSFILTKKEIKKILNKYFYFINFSLLFIFSLILVFISGKNVFSYQQERQVLSSSKNAFLFPTKNILNNSLDLSFIEGNALANVSSPIIITPKILGSIINEDFTEQRDQIIEYEVKPGDTLYSIASKFNISLNTLLWANNLSRDSKIKVGKKLIVLPVSGILYTVKNGDTLSSIAKRYKADIGKIISFNHLSEEGDIYIGDLLIIPGGKIPNKPLRNIASIPVAKSYFIFPCQGIITQGLHYYNAIDIANKCGLPVVAAASGTVKRAGWIRIGGKRIIIIHPNGVATYYGHLSKILVKPGQKVKTGDIIGYIGNTGYTLGPTGCHLHFGIIGAKNFLAKYPVGTRISWK